MSELIDTMVPLLPLFKRHVFKLYVGAYTYLQTTHTVGNVLLLI